MKSKCCGAEMVQDTHGFGAVIFSMGAVSIGTDYLCLKCGKKFKPEELPEGKK